MSGDVDDARGAAAPGSAASDALRDALGRFTVARVALGRHGASLPTAPQLAFQQAHAMARDAVHARLDAAALTASLRAAGEGAVGVPPPGCLTLHSAAATREIYLQRPDLGRQLSAASRAALLALPRSECDLAFVIADGLSALAIQQHAMQFLSALLPRLQADAFSIGPLTIVEQARVAIGDEIGELLRARAVVVLIGERPGLSSPDSMGLYMTWSPQRGLTDEARNCISNVRPAGLSYAAAAHRLHYLLDQSRQRQLSGVLLKDETVASEIALSRSSNFLVL